MPEIGPSYFVLRHESGQMTQWENSVDTLEKLKTATT